MTRTPSSCDWVGSGVTEQLLFDFVESGMLPSKEEIHWRVPGSEKRPEPKEGEIIVFTDHILRGFRPPGSKFFRDVLHFFQIHPQDIGPNSITNICQFQVLNEVYMQEEPSVDLFYEYHYANRQTEMAAGPALELGGVTIQRRRDLPYPSATLPSHPKDWNKTWFYCQDTSPEGENPLPGYRPTRLSFNDHPLPARMTAAERAKYAPAYTKVKALLANGLTGVDLTRCWVSWKILPLSRRDRLMCEYTGEPNDPLCFKNTLLTDEDINTAVKGLLGESQEACNKVGLEPFYVKNPAPDANSPFWKKKFNAPVRKPKTKAPAKKKKKAATPEPVESDNSEDETEASRANAPEVIDISDSEIFPQDKVRRAVRKVPFSHPLAYLDPNFLLKKQQHNPRRQTQSAGSADLAAGLPHSPAQRKRPAEASPPSSGDSTASKLPPMKINPEAQAKRRKTGGSTAAPVAKEPVFAKPATPPAVDIMKDTPQPPEPAGHDTTAESPARDDPKPPSPSMADEDTALPDVAITGMGHHTPQPHVLTRHSGKAEASSLEDFNVEPSVLEKFTADELHAGFLNRLESSRRTELKLVGLMKKRYEQSRDAKQKPGPEISVQELASRAASRYMSSTVKIVKTPKTAYDFEVSWRAISDDLTQQIQLLKSIPPERLPEIFKDALSSAFLIDIVKCTASIFRDDAVLAVSILENLAKVSRFDLIIMCLSPMHKSELRKIWSQTFLVETASPDQVEALRRLQAKYVQGGWHDDMFTLS